LGSTNTDSFPSIPGFIMLMITTWRMHSLYVRELFFFQQNLVQMTI
jgi:hypothetical protein